MAAASEAPPPKLAVRLILWFFIYLAAQVPIIWRLGSDSRPLDPLIFPSRLGWLFCLPLYWLPIPASIEGEPSMFLVGYIFGYLTYFAHLAATSRAKTRRRFSFLMLELTTLVLINQGLFWSMYQVIYD